MGRCEFFVARLVYTKQILLRHHNDNDNRRFKNRKKERKEEEKKRGGEGNDTEVIGKEVREKCRGSLKCEGP
jgi:hypothetical protein